MKNGAKPRKRAKRDRSAVLLRLDPKIAEWFQEAAKRKSRSRTNLMELWLAVLPETLAQMEELDREGWNPEDALRALGIAIGYRMRDLGIVSDFVSEGRALHEERIAYERRLIELDKKNRGGE